MVTFDRISEAHPASIAGALGTHAVAHHDGESVEHAIAAQTAASMTALALTAGHASLEAHRAGTAVDAGGLLPDLQRTNSWTQKVEEVDPLEALEVQAVQLDRTLHPRLAAAPGDAGRGRGWCAEGVRRQRVRDGGPVLPPLQGSRPPAHEHGQGRAQHDDPHERRRDVRDRPHPHDGRRHRLDHRRAPARRESLRIAAEGWHAPLDLVDGAARVYDPIVRGEAGEDLYGCFVKDYEPSPW